MDMAVLVSGEVKKMVRLIIIIILCLVLFYILGIDFQSFTEFVYDNAVSLLEFAKQIAKEVLNVVKP
jgi:cell shape-determining protein MreC